MKFLNTFILAICLSLFFAGSPAPSPYGVGDTVSNFKLKNVDGSYFSLDNLQNEKGAIVIFDCNTCPFSKAYNDRIVALHKKYDSKGFPVVAINANDPQKSPGDSFDEMVRIAKDKHYEFPYLIDEAQSVAKAFGATNTPHVFVIQRDGNSFKVAYIGAIDNNARDSAAADKKYVEEAVDALLEGRPAPTTKTKALGCGIKWKNV
jgi:peroxiredoxin